MLNGSHITQDVDEKGYQVYSCPQAIVSLSNCMYINTSKIIEILSPHCSCRLSSSIVARTHDVLTLLGMLAQRRWTRVLYCKASHPCSTTCLT